MISLFSKNYKRIELIIIIRVAELNIKYGFGNYT